MSKISKVYISNIPEEFFKSDDPFGVNLSASAAANVCKDAKDHGLTIVRIEGGINREFGIESRLDCIWNSLLPPTELKDVVINNDQAAKFITAISLNGNADVFAIYAHSFYKEIT